MPANLAVLARGERLAPFELPPMVAYLTERQNTRVRRRPGGPSNGADEYGAAGLQQPGRQV